MRLLDTDMLSALVKTSVPTGVDRKMRAMPRVYTSAVNVAEVLFGVEKARSRRLRELYDKLVFPQVTILPFDERAAEEYARLRAELEAAGTPLNETDLMIASIALANEMVLVTGNIAHFERVPGLELENWLG